MSRGLQLLFLLLSCACSLVASTQEVKVPCSETVDLPCAVSWDPQVAYAVSWAKVTESGEQRLEPPQEGLRLSGQRHHQSGQNASSETSGKEPYSLKIQNTTGCSSGTYRCTLQDMGEQKNLSGTVLLKVTGCPKLPEESTFRKYRAEIVLLFSLVIFYLTLIIFTCKFARLQSIFPDISKPGMEQAFLPVTSPSKHLGPVTLPKIETV
ncbi:CD83 antigen [Perognathus longimembris pacificus]|uniref:CD83 antigen n=1 Tax=Perognathus longimembris pacificus TaxID=214514 RepID=UPI002019F862|nr:CD83 antigen [Perognathus longimembris pacificus]